MTRNCFVASTLFLQCALQQRSEAESLSAICQLLEQLNRGLKTGLPTPGNIPQNKGLQFVDHWSFAAPEHLPRLQLFSLRSVQACLVLCSALSVRWLVTLFNDRQIGQSVVSTQSVRQSFRDTSTQQGFRRVADVGRNSLSSRRMSG